MSDRDPALEFAQAVKRENARLYALLRSERERADRLAAALRSVLHRFRHSSEDGWYQDVRAALKEQEP